ncbi:hypothetical protein L5515_008880 [Caenorhabditis briggsae]|uniref:Uncharacterized protein n=1 Tax=Caenorhabditis briggsae TaxID=6238 RepID=A0AAE9F7E4_CAEBR|nr:hypothetical protein L5515_008880 [Caenorhabditis briggsae]
MFANPKSDAPFNHLAEKNSDYIDARIPSQFTEQDPLSATYPGTKAKRSHVTGAINFPMADVIGPNACNTGIQAPVIFTALERSESKRNYTMEA